MKRVVVRGEGSSSNRGGNNSSQKSRQSSQRSHQSSQRSHQSSQRSHQSSQRSHQSSQKSRQSSLGSRHSSSRSSGGNKVVVGGCSNKYDSGGGVGGAKGMAGSAGVAAEVGGTGVAGVCISGPNTTVASCCSPLLSGERTKAGGLGNSPSPSHNPSTSTHIPHSHASMTSPHQSTQVGDTRGQGTPYQPVKSCSADGESLPTWATGDRDMCTMYADIQSTSARESAVPQCSTQGGSCVEPNTIDSRRSPHHPSAASSSKATLPTSSAIHSQPANAAQLQARDKATGNTTAYPRGADNSTIDVGVAAFTPAPVSGECSGSDRRRVAPATGISSHSVEAKDRGEKSDDSALIQAGGEGESQASRAKYAASLTSRSISDAGLILLRDEAKTIGAARGGDESTKGGHSSGAHDHEGANQVMGDGAGCGGSGGGDGGGSGGDGGGSGEDGVGEGGVGDRMTNDPAPIRGMKVNWSCNW